MNANTSVISSRSSIPIQLSFLFEEPPLLSAEDRRAYYALVENVLVAIRPEDGIVLIFVKEFVDSTWEVYRWRLMRVAAIKMSRKDALVNMLQSVLSNGDIPEGSDRRATAEAMAEQWFAGPDSSMPIRKILGRLNLCEVEIEAQAAVLRMDDLAAYDELIESAGQRRNQALAMIEKYRVTLADRLRAIAPELVHDEPKRISLAPGVGD